MREEDLLSLLKNLGLTEYESRSYVALIDLKRAKAKDISDVASIAYPKVYSVLTSLKKKGFVEEELGRPRIFKPVDPNKAIRNYIEERISMLKSQAEQAIRTLATRYKSSSDGKGGAVVVQGKRNVLSKLREVILKAQREVFISAPSFELLGIKALLLDLNAAKKRGVDVRILTSPSTLSKDIEMISDLIDIRIKEGLESCYVITDAGSLLISGKSDDLRAIFIIDEITVRPTREHFNYTWFESMPASSYLGCRASKRGVIILAGGASRRMGKDKALLSVKGVPMIKRVTDVALKVSGEVIIVTSNRRSLRDISGVVGGGVTIVEDEERGWGPIMGIFTGCKRARAEYVAVVPCDVPFLNPKVLLELFKRAEGHEAAIPLWPNGFLEPLQSVYRRQTVLDIVEGLIKKGSRSIMHLISSLRDVVYVPVEELKLIDEKLLTFFNVNTPRDLLMAEAIETT
ncbi:MAG: NTP transferase domain-containing protein [Candidatus Nezhaarchaeales archaeon]